MNVDLPTPGTPVIPTRCAAAGVGQQPGRAAPGRARWCSGWVDSTSVIARPSAVRLPASTPSRRRRSAGSTVDGVAPRRRPSRRGRQRAERDGATGRSSTLSGRASSSRRSTAASAITVPGGKIAAAPAARSASKSCGGMTPPTTIRMSSRPSSASSALQLGHEREVAGGERRHADDVHVGLDRLAGDLAGRLEQRADVDVEAEVGERGGDHLLAAVVAVLAHLGDQDRGGGGRARSANASTSARARLDVGRLADLVAVHARDRTDRAGVAAVHLLQRVADLADGGAARGRRRPPARAGLVEPGVAGAVDRGLRPAPVSGVERGLAGGARRARPAAGAAWRSAAVRTDVLSTLSTSISLGARRAVLVDADRPAGGRSRCGPGCGPRPPRCAAWGCRPRSPRSCRPPPRPRRCAPTPCAASS